MFSAQQLLLHRMVQKGAHKTPYCYCIKNVEVRSEMTTKFLLGWRQNFKTIASIAFKNRFHRAQSQVFFHYGHCVLTYAQTPLYKHKVCTVRTNENYSNDAPIYLRASGKSPALNSYTHKTFQLTQTYVFNKTSLLHDMGCTSECFISCYIG